MQGKLGKVGLFVLIIFAGLAIMSFVLPRINEMYYPLFGTDPEIIGTSPPSLRHPFGTDSLGRDLFSQVCSGAYFAFLHGVELSIIGVPVLGVAAFVMAQLRSKTPFKDTFLTRYVQFVIFPLGVAALFSLLLYLLASPWGGRLSWATMLLLSPVFVFLAWLSMGHELETMFRNREKVSLKLLSSGALLFFSYTVIFEVILALTKTGDPSVTNWANMVLTCGTFSEIESPLWHLVLPLVVTYVFSRGMVALSYWLYNSGAKEKYFFREGWF